MKEYFIYKKNYKGALNSTLLTKSLYQKLWDDSPYLLKQLPGIGMVTAKVFSIDFFIVSYDIWFQSLRLVKNRSNAICRHCIQWELTHLRL